MPYFALYFYLTRVKQLRQTGEVVGYQIRHSRCKKCHNEYIKQKRMSDLLNNRPKFLCRSYRHLDKKSGRENNLTRELIAEYIAQPCFYCGGDDVSMGLDRIDNSQGHIVGNVNPCCNRCNTIRRNMPYEAWLLIISGVKQARLKGMFGDWIGVGTCKGKYPVR